MSTFLDYSGRLGRGGFAFRFLLTAALWAGLIYVMLHYVGRVWPQEYQIHHALQEEQNERAKAVISATIVSVEEGTPAPAPAAPTTPASATAAPAATTTAAATTSATPAAAAAPAAASATPAPVTAAKPGAKEALPYDRRLNGYNRHAFGNVAIFYSIVISVLSAGVVLSHVIRRLRDAGMHGYWAIGMLVPGVMITTTYIMHHNTFQYAPITPLQWMWDIFMVLNALVFLAVLFSALFKPSAASGAGASDHAHAH